MKKAFFILLFSCILVFKIFALDSYIIHSYSADFGLFPDSIYKERYIKELSGKYAVHYSVQSVFEIPKTEVSGYSCQQILQKLDQMGGLDKECQGVSYVDLDGERKPIFKKSSFDEKTSELFIKDKAAGGLYFSVKIDQYDSDGNVYAVSAILNRKPNNIFVRGIKKDEAEIFVLMQEKKDTVKVYALIQCSYNPLEHKFLKTLVENAVTARVMELQNWFYRMLCTKQ